MIAAKPKTLKESNRRTILNFLRSTEAVTVNDIHRKVGLSKTTVMKIMTYFVEKGIVSEAGKGRSTDEGGKKPLLYSFNDSFGFAIGVHIFPREVYLLASDLRLKVLAEHSETIHENEELPVVIETIARGIEKLYGSVNAENLLGIALGSHGITNFEDGVVQLSPHFPSWGENAPVKKMLGDALGGLPSARQTEIYVDNQIRFQVFGEQTFGLAQDKKNIIVIEGGEGLVAGIIGENEIKRGVHFVAGEIGHMVLNPSDEETCSCGGRGCFEVQVSTGRLLRRAEILRKEYSDSALFRDRVLETGGVDAVFRYADEGDTLSRFLMDDVIRWFAYGLSNMTMMHDPEIIIIQGAYSRAGDYFLKRLREEVNSCVLVGLPKKVEIHYSRLGKERGALGGTAFVISEYFSKELLYSR